MKREVGALAQQHSTDTKKWDSVKIEMERKWWSAVSSGREYVGGRKGRGTGARGDENQAHEDWGVSRRKRNRHRGECGGRLVNARDEMCAECQKTKGMGQWDSDTAKPKDKHQH